MSMIIPLAVGLIIAGLVICWLRASAGNAVLVTVLLWTGIILIVVGLILLLSPVILWANAQIRSMLGA